MRLQEVCEVTCDKTHKVSITEITIMQIVGCSSLFYLKGFKRITSHDTFGSVSMHGIAGIYVRFGLALYVKPDLKTNIQTYNRHESHIP